MTDKTPKLAAAPPVAHGEDSLQEGYDLKLRLNQVRDDVQRLTLEATPQNWQLMRDDIGRMKTMLFWLEQIYTPPVVIQSYPFESDADLKIDAQVLADQVEDIAEKATHDNWHIIQPFAEKAKLGLEKLTEGMRDERR